MKLINAPAQKKILKAVTLMDEPPMQSSLFNQQQFVPGSQQAVPDKSVTS